MDADRFDSLARSVTSAPSRRGVARALAGLTLTGMLAPWLGLADTKARKRHKKRKKKKGGKPPTCVDGIKNGSETDVDCGGACPRCANGQSCLSLNDCAGGAACPGGTCQACNSNEDCGSDADGQCYCASPATGGPKVCISTPTGSPPPSCNSCPTGTICVQTTLYDASCFKLCGAA